MKIRRTRGFTIVELLVVIAVIGVLVAMTIFGFGSWRKRTAETEVKSALTSVSSAMKNAKNFGSGYPTNFPAGYSAHAHVVLELVSASSTAYCINGYSTEVASVRMSISSTNDKTVRSYLCPITGSVVATLGGSVPTAPRGVDLAPKLSAWLLNAGASYNTTDESLSVGSATQYTYASSGLIRVDQPTGITVNGLFYAAQQSTSGTYQPNAAWHMTIYYYAADGTTAVTNSSGNTLNGCAKSFPLSTWSTTSDCTFNGGPNVIYIDVRIIGPYGNTSSPDLKMKQIKIITT